MSRAKSIRTLIEVHVTTAFSGVVISNVPRSFDDISKDKFPHAIVFTIEEDPERLDFKQELRVVTTVLHLAVLTTPGDTAEATREAVDVVMEAIRDALYTDEDLSGTVDNVNGEAAETFSGFDDSIVYGTLEVTTEELF